jgi:histidinol-phosphatase (PHP family)
MIVDYHLHLRPDGSALDDGAYASEHLQQYVAAARGRGVGEIAITEHVYRFRQAADLSDHVYWREHTLYDMTVYCDRLAAARDSGLPILVGLELDWLGAERADGVRALAASYPWDVVLGSVHWSGPLAFDHPNYPIWDAYPVDEVWRMYADAVCAAAETGIYDVMAHPDLAKVFGQRPSAAVGDELGDQLADCFRAAGVCAEISSGGLRKPAGEIYPSDAWLAKLRAAGVPVTLASDAHVPGDVGLGVDRCLVAAAAAGYTSVARFRGREWAQVPLG